ncbi:hypothetical protein B296_00018483 [Ensete ventricosum]|uniref:Uncharacterized protein n=1 Tax=Ensete ventricosum TaxID=4639 RepID=A0A426Z2K8_ENSVE|nr:hypothetical protein B296_00018483 [Ensete ventricosum]
MTEMYGGRTVATAWGEGMACHVTLMCVELGSVEKACSVFFFCVTALKRGFPGDVPHCDDDDDDDDEGTRLVSVLHMPALASSGSCR